MENPHYQEIIGKFNALGTGIDLEEASLRNLVEDRDARWYLEQAGVPGDVREYLVEQARRSYPVLKWGLLEMSDIMCHRTREESIL